MFDHDTEEALKALLKAFPGSKLLTPAECGCRECIESTEEPKPDLSPLRRSVYSRASEIGYRRLQLAQAVSVIPGKSNWERFTQTAREERLQQALNALERSEAA